MATMHIRYFGAMLAIAAATQAMAANFKFLPGKTNWADPASYSTDIWHDNKVATSLPGASDVVYVMGSDQITVDASDADSWAAINRIGRITFWTDEGTFIVNVPSGSVNLSTPVCYSGFKREINRHHGWLVKTGAGELHLTGTGDWCYEVKIVARAGDLYLQQDIMTENVYYCTLAVSNNATIHMPTWSASAPKVGWCYFGGFGGDGTIAAAKSTTCYAHGNIPMVFSGTLSEDLSVFWGSPQTLLTDRTRGSTLVAYDYETYNATNDSCLAVTHIGAPNEPSPLGTNGTINVGLNSGGGGLRYLGSGETVTKTISVNHSQLSPAIIDGGPNGNLIWNGTIKHNAYVPQMHRIKFCGENANPCTFGGAMTTDKKSGTNYSFYVTKTGTGTWRFTDNAERNWRGGLAVEDGTLQFNSLDDAGYVSALGYADWLYARDTMLRTPEKEVPYAIALGDPEGEGEPVFEYTGEETSRSATRPVVLKGDAHIRNNGAAAFRLHGVSAYGAAARTLTLDGAGTGANDIFNIIDGDGTVSVVKDGPGTWFIGGTNSFSGSLSVKNGTLYVRDPAKYTFYRWNIMQTTREGSWYMVASRAFGLFDANGNRLNANLKEGGRRGILAPGDAGYDHDRWFSAVSPCTALTNLFCDACTWSTYGKVGKTEATTTISPFATNESSWITIQMRLPNGSADVNSYDFAVIGYKASDRVKSVGIWSVEASSDGIAWDEVIPVQTNLEIGVEWNYRWVSDEVTYCTNGVNSSVHTTGMAIAGRKTVGIAPSLNNVSSVSVSPGAVLTTDAGSGLAVSALSIPASDADAAVPGVISNFTLAASGTIAVTGVESPLPRDFSVKVDVSGCENTSAIAGWSVSLEGGAAGKYKTVLGADGAVRVFRPGMTFTIR